MVLVSVFIFSACEEAELFPRYGESEGEVYVAFASASTDVSESGAQAFADGSSVVSNNVQAIRIVRGGTDLSEAVTVSVTVAATYVDDNDFVSAGEDALDQIKIGSDLSALTIPAGKSSASFNVITTNNDISQGNISVVFTITSVSDATYQIGYLSGNVRASTTLNVIDDDCPIDLASFVGEYSYTVVGTDYNANFAGDDLCGFNICPTGNITLAVDASDATGKTAILTGADLGSDYIIEFITCPKQVEVKNSLSSFLGRTAWAMQQGSVLGTYDDASKDININGVLGTNGDWTIKMKKVN